MAFERTYMKIFRDIYKSITNNTIVFVAFMLLMILSVCSLLFVFNFVLNAVDYNTKLFEGEDITLAEQYLKDSAAISGFMLMSVFNLAYVYSYILDARKKEIAINRISGQTVFSAIIASYSEILILSTIGYIIGVLIMKLIVLPIISNLKFMFKDSIDAPQYFMLYLIFILIYSIVFLPSIISQMRKAPTEALTDE